jgi:hypothetical protein
MHSISTFFLFRTVLDITYIISTKGTPIFLADLLYVVAEMVNLYAFSQIDFYKTVFKSQLLGNSAPPSEKTWKDIGKQG